MARGVFGQVEQGTAAGAGQPAGEGEDPQPESFGFPPAGGVGGEGEHLGQVVSSQASSTMAHQIRFWAMSCRLRAP